MRRFTITWVLVAILAWAGPACAQSGALLFGVDVGSDTLLSIDPGDGSTMEIGSVASPVIAGLEYDCESGLLLGVDTSTGALVTIDPWTGSTVVVGDTGIDLLHGLALDPASGTLYGSVGAIGSDLYAIDRQMGVASWVGPIGFDWVAGLDFDPLTGALFGVVAGPADDGSLITIDLVTGAGTLVGPTHRLNSIAFGADGSLIGSDNVTTPGVDTTLYAIDPSSGDWDLIAETTFDNILGIVFDACGGSGPPVLRGDVDGSGGVSPLADGLYLLAFGFVAGSPPPPCATAADVDGNQQLNPLVDGLYLLNFGFVPASPPPPFPYPDCGPDDSGIASLGCALLPPASHPGLITIGVASPRPTCSPSPFPAQPL